MATMTEITADGEIIESQEIAIRPPAPMTLFGTDDPERFVEHATKVASSLAAVLNKQKLYAVIQNRKFITVEGWTFLGSMVGVFPVTRWTRPITVGELSGWEARVEAVTRSGDIVGAAEAICLKGESATWTLKSPENAVRSMAQTRATSKALRQPLDFLVKLAGYATTPAEEMVAMPPSTAAGGQQGARAAHTKPTDTPVAAAQPSAPPGPQPIPPKNPITIGKKTAPAAEEESPPLEDDPLMLLPPRAEPPPADVSPAQLYTMAIELGKKYLQIQDPENPLWEDEAGWTDKALKALDKSSIEKYGSPLDRLNVTHLMKVIQSLELLLNR